MFRKYKLNDEERALINRLLAMKDWNQEDGYAKKDIIEIVNSNKALDKDDIRQVRNYVIQKNLEYGFENDEPNDLGYKTEEFFDKLLDILEEKNYDIYYLRTKVLYYFDEFFDVDLLKINCDHNLVHIKGQRKGQIDI